MKSKGWMAIAAMAMSGALLFADAGLAEPSPGGRSGAEIAALDLDAVAAALREDTGALAAYMAELHRRYPDQVELLEGVEVPALDAQSRAAIRDASDDALGQAIEVVSGEIDRLVAHGETLQASAAAPPGPQSRPAAPDAAKALGANDENGDYCYKMYGEAYSLCDRDDRSCKFIAASDWDICKQTGRWP